MISYRDGQAIALCDTCYRVPPSQTLITKQGRERSLRMTDSDVTRGEGMTTRDELHFCNDECAASYTAPKRR